MNSYFDWSRMYGFSAPSLSLLFGLYTMMNQEHTNQVLQAYLDSPGYQANNEYCAYLNNHGMYYQYSKECENGGPRTLDAHGFHGG
jgi:hypothetical protein